ncbi:hypothetical protein V498_07906 [Pseudogymnoascus sp. VKM F-4517 (FW-2822)]|nr:hypothetical protein V498_07906 [Pseudogymnoascus sp. VKM F-4517 (FW-2822)]
MADDIKQALVIYRQSVPSTRRHNTLNLSRRIRINNRQPLKSRKKVLSIAKRPRLGIYISLTVASQARTAHPHRRLIGAEQQAHEAVVRDVGDVLEDAPLEEALAGIGAFEGVPAVVLPDTVDGVEERVAA